jgi:hypothetical protein
LQTSSVLFRAATRVISLRMNIEKLRLDPRFVLLCAILIVVWLALQEVTDERIKLEASTSVNRLYNWNWSRLGVRSSFKIEKVKILKKTNTDAIVEVRGKQTLMWSTKSENVSPHIKYFTSKSQLDEERGTILTFYKLSNNWVLGQVELR